MNYASRSDMHRERARERVERARRQWELEHGDSQTNGGGGQYNQVPSYEATVVSMVFLYSTLLKVLFFKFYFILLNLIRPEFTHFKI